MVNDDLTFSFVQTLRPLNSSADNKGYPITDIAVHEGLGIIGIILKNEVICHVPSVVKFVSSDEFAGDFVSRTVWVHCANLSLEDDISCISWMPGIHNENPSRHGGGIRMIMLATATKHLTFWECTLSEDAPLEVSSPRLTSMDTMLRFKKRYSTAVSNTVTGLAYSNDGFFLAEMCLNSSFVKVWYEYDSNTFSDFYRERSCPGIPSEHTVPKIKKKNSCGFGYLPHPKCVYDISWKPVTQARPVIEASKPDIDSAVLLTNCHDGAARIWMPIHDSGIFKFCLVAFIQSNPIESIKNTNHYIDSKTGFALMSLSKRQKKTKVIYSPVVWLSLCTNTRGYRNTKSSNDTAAKKDGTNYLSSSQKNANADLNGLSGSPHKHLPFYDFIDLGKKQLDTGHPVLFQVKRDSTILFCKLEGSDGKNKLHTQNSGSRCGLSCLKSTTSGLNSPTIYASPVQNVSAGSKSLKPRNIMCALNSPCKEFIQFFSDGFVMPYLFVNPEPQIIEYNNIVLLEKALLIGVNHNGYMQAFSIFIKACEESLWVIPRIVPLQSFYASSDPVTNVWPHNNVNIPLHITVSCLYDDPLKPKYATYTLSVYYGPISSNTSLISILKIKSPVKDVINGEKLSDDIRIEWVQTSPAFIVWGLSMLRPLVYTVEISNNSPPRNSSPAVHRSYSRCFESNSSRGSSIEYWRTKKRKHVGRCSNTYYTLESGVTFIGYIPVCAGSETDDVRKRENDTVTPRLIMLQSFDSASHDPNYKSADLNTSLYFKSAILAVFDDGFYNFWNLTFDGAPSFKPVLFSKAYLPDLPQNQAIKMADHLFSPCEFFQLSFTIGYHLFVVVVKLSENKDVLIFYKYGALGDNCLQNHIHNDKEYMCSVGKTELDQNIKIIKGDMLEFSCTVSQIHNKLYCLCIWNISEEGMYRRLVHYETFKEEIVSADWLVLPSSQMVLAIAQRHRVMIYCKLNRSIGHGKNMWTRLNPFTTTCSETISAVKWLPSDGYKLAVITEDVIFLLEDYVNNWNLPTDGNPLPEIRSRMHLNLFSEVDALEEQSCNYNIYMLYHYMLLGKYTPVT